MKDCPDLTKMSPEEKAEFWKTHDPLELKRVGDQLLAESLPHVETSFSREQVSQEVVQARESLGWTVEKVSEALGVTSDLYAAWELDRVRPPESLPFVLRKLREVSAG